jgi:hypothetical protein
MPHIQLLRFILILSSHLCLGLQSVNVNVNIFRQILNCCECSIPYTYQKTSSNKILVAYRGTLTRYGGYWGNKIPGVDQNQHHYLVTKGDLQTLGEETPTKNQPAQRLRWQPHH